MNQLPARAGWHWVKQGFSLFRKQAGALTMLFFGALMVMLSLGIIPVLGQILFCIGTPLYMAAFTQACSDMEQERRLLPVVLISGLRSPATRTLLKLGVLYLLAASLIIGLSMLID